MGNMAENGYLMSIKEYAEKQNITQQAVYQQIKRKTNKDALKGHIIKRDGKTFLDEYAVKHLEKQRDNTSTVIIQSDDKAEIERLHGEIERLKGVIAEMQERHIKALETQNKQILDLSEKVLALTTKKEEPAPARSWWQKLFQ